MKLLYLLCTLLIGITLSTRLNAHGGGKCHCPGPAHSNHGVSAITPGFSWLQNPSATLAGLLILGPIPPLLMMRCLRPGRALKGM